MKEQIIIQNFGPLKNIKLDIRQFTVLIGESAIGKSTLMKIVSMMRYIYKMANIRSYLKLSKITSSPFRMRFESMINQSGLQSMLTQETNIKYTVSLKSGNSYSISVSEKKLSVLPNIKKEDLVFIKNSFVSENRNVLPMWIEKASLNAGATLGFYFHETLKDFSRLSENDHIIDLSYVNFNLRVSHPKGKPTKYLLEHHTDHKLKLDLKEASSGIQTSAPLVLIVNHFSNDYSFKDAFNRSVLNYLHDVDLLTKFKAITEPSELKNHIYIHIEEPELSLFPDAQCKLIDNMIYTATHAQTDRQVNLMLATHSPYILNYLNIILNQTSESKAKLSHNKLAVYRIYDGQICNLLVQDENKKYLVDTYDLTEMMETIFNEYNQLNSVSQ